MNRLDALLFVFRQAFPRTLPSKSGDSNSGLNAPLESPKRQLKLLVVKVLAANDMGDGNDRNDGRALRKIALNMADTIRCSIYYSVKADYGGGADWITSTIRLGDFSA